MSNGFSYYLEDDNLIEYRKLSDEQKLRWLEEINEFIRMVLSEKELEIREKLRAGLL